MLPVVMYFQFQLESFLTLPLNLSKMQDGIMATHDEETRCFFKHSSVQVLLCPRNAGKKHSWVKQRVSYPKLQLFLSCVIALKQCLVPGE
jgi:hypothetical protein